MSEKKQLLDLPNRWISIDPNSNTVLTYAPQVNPAPLTVSLPGKDPKLASLEIVITNETDDPVAVSSISITFNVGDSNALMQTTQGVNYAVSDGQSWNVTPPPSPVSSGEATYKLGPKVGSSVTLPSNGSVVLQLYQFQTIIQPSSVTVTVKESLANLDPAFAYFQITTFSDSFYFNSLSVTVADGSSYAPVAQVPLNTRVTLLWNASVMEVTAFDVFQSTAAGPAPPQKPNKVGEWLSPPLTDNTVFTVKVRANLPGGAPVVASLCTSVGVQDPAPILSALTVNGPTTLAKTLTAADISASSSVIAASVTASGAVSGQSVTASGAVSGAQGSFVDAVVTSSLTAQNLTVNGTLVGNGPAQLMQQPVALGLKSNQSDQINRTYKTDGILVIAITSPGASTEYMAGGTVVVQFGGNLIASIAGGWLASQSMFLPTSICVPVPANTPITVTSTIWNYTPLFTANYIALGKGS